MLDILYFYISMYIFLSFFLNIDLWKTCKIALAKCFSALNKDHVMLCLQDRNAMKILITLERHGKRLINNNFRV